MKNTLRICFVLLQLALGIKVTYAQNEAVSVQLTWPNGAKAAYSIFHDDICDRVLLGQPSGFFDLIVPLIADLNYQYSSKRNKNPIKITFSVIGAALARGEEIRQKNSCAVRLKKILTDKYIQPEIANHSFFHTHYSTWTDGEIPCPKSVSPPPWKNGSKYCNIVDSKKRIMDLIPTQVDVYVYPYNETGSIKDTLAQMKSHYLGARYWHIGMNEDVRAYDISNCGTNPLPPEGMNKIYYGQGRDMVALFAADPYNAESQETRVQSLFSTTPTIGAKNCYEYAQKKYEHYAQRGKPVLDVYVDYAVDHGTWAVRALHSAWGAYKGVKVDAASQFWIPINIMTYKKHLRYVYQKYIRIGMLHMDYSSTLIKYIAKASACGTPVFKSNQLTFSNIASDVCRQSYPKVALYVKIKNLPYDTEFVLANKNNKISCPNDFGVLAKQPIYLTAKGETVVRIYPTCGSLKIKRSRPV